MKKTIISIILVFMLILSSTAALAQKTGTLNVYSEVSGVQLYVDENFIGEGTTLNFSTSAGSHYLKAVKNGKIIHSEVVTINEGETTTVVIKGTTEKEHGNIGLGLNLAPIAYGISGKFWFKPIGLQLTIYPYTSDLFSLTHFGGRFLYLLNDSPDADLYLGFGIGSATVSSGDLEVSWPISEMQLVLGFEGPMGAKEVTWCIETGYTQYTYQGDYLSGTSGGLLLGLGFHYYF